MQRQLNHPNRLEWDEATAAWVESPSIGDPNEHSVSDTHTNHVFGGVLKNALAKLTFIYKESAFMYPGQNVQSVIKRSAFVAYSLANLKAVSNWLSSENTLLSKELKQFPGLKELAFRPYVNAHWGVDERLHAMANHYALVKHHSPFLNINHDSVIELLQIPFKEDVIRVTIDKPLWMRREGEVALSLYLGIDRIYTVMFLLSGKPNNLNAIVGSLQGDGRERQEAYKSFTKHFHGVRPRDFLINMFKMLAENIGCKEIYAVSDEAHRSSLWYSKAHKDSKYNAIWPEHNGVLNSEGFYVIPAAIQKRDISEVSSKKRAMYRRRYAFFDDLQAQLKEVLLDHPPVNIFKRDRRMRSRHDEI